MSDPLEEINARYINSNDFIDMIRRPSGLTQIALDLRKLIECVRFQDRVLEKFLSMDGFEENQKKHMDIRKDLLTL